MKINEQLLDESLKAIRAKILEPLNIELEGIKIDHYNEGSREYYSGYNSGSEPDEIYYRIKKERKTRTVAHFEVWDDGDGKRNVFVLKVIDDKPHYLNEDIPVRYTNCVEIPNTRREEEY